jgi:hypothetical protein
MDRRSYNPKAIAIFDIMGSYFVDVFYNHHYLIARENVKAGKQNNITDAYRSNVMSYMYGIKTRVDLYKTVVGQLHKFYQSASGFGAITLSDLENKILSQFIPPEYYRDFSDQMKGNTMREIIIRSVQEFGAITVSYDMLRNIIDDHMNSAHVRTLQDQMVDIYIIIREDYYSRFTQAILSGGNDKVSKGVLEKLKVAYTAEKKKKCELASDKERAVSIIQGLMKRITELEAEVGQLKRAAAPPAYPSTSHALPSQMLPSQILPKSPPPSQPQQSPPQHPRASAPDPFRSMFGSSSTPPPAPMSPASSANLPVELPATILGPPFDNMIESESEESEDEATAHERQRKLIEQRRSGTSITTTAITMPPTSALPNISIDDDPWASPALLG